MRLSHQRELQRILTEQTLQNSTSQVPELLSKVDAQQVRINLTNFSFQDHANHNSICFSDHLEFCSLKKSLEVQHFFTLILQC